MPIGTVKFFDAAKGFGFIAPDDGSGDTFIHATAVELAGLAGLNQDQRVSYDIVQGKGGKSQAANLSLVDGPAAEAARPEAVASDG